MRRRTTEQLAEYWEGLKGSRPYPSESDIEPDAISEIWNACFQVQIKHGANPEDRFKYDYLGQKIIDAYRCKMGVDDAKKLTSILTPDVAKRMEEVVASRKPLYCETEYADADNVVVKCRLGLFPLGNETALTHIFGCIQWKEF